MSIINESIEVTRPAAYAWLHRSGPRRARASRSACFSEVVHRLVDNRDPCAFGDGVPGAEDPRRPRVVAFEYRRGGERNQRVDECELVMELANMCEAFTHHGDRGIGVSAPHFEDGANVQRQR